MLTFAGEPLLFPTPEVDAFLARNLELCDMRQYGAQQRRIASGRHVCRSRFEQDKGLGLPVIAWPEPPAPRLNTLYWPTGATRWAQGWFLASNDTLTQILKNIKPTSENSGVKKGSLGIGDDLDGTTDTPVNFIDMWMLPPRPLTAVSGQGTNRLWLLPLVDERYFWQYIGVDSLAVTSSTTWDSLFSTLGTKLGVTVSVQSSIEAAYLKPDPVDFTRKYDNAALLLDAAAWSVGRRIVRKINGDVICQSQDRAVASSDEDDKKNTTILAGQGFEHLGRDLPQWLLVTFRKIKQHLLRSNGQLHTVEREAPDGTEFVGSKRLTIHCAAYADYNTSDALQNGTALDALAEQIRDDYFAWHERRYDLTYPGVADIKPCGFDDAILWTFGRTCPDKTLRLSRNDDGTVANLEVVDEPLAYTRVWSLPADIWPEINLCSDSTKSIVEPRMMAIANEDIAAGATGEVSLYDSFSHDTGKDVEATNISGADWISGSRGWAEGIGDAVWLGTPAECD
jgi:hypothetical protein